MSLLGEELDDLLFQIEKSGSQRELRGQLTGFIKHQPQDAWTQQLADQNATHNAEVNLKSIKQVGKIYRMAIG